MRARRPRACAPHGIFCQGFVNKRYVEQENVPAWYYLIASLIPPAHVASSLPFVRGIVVNAALLGSLGRRFGSLLEAVLKPLEVSWGPLGGFLRASCGPLGGLLGPLGGLLGPRVRNFVSCSLSGAPLEAFLGPSWAVLGASWRPLGPSWSRLGPSWGPPGGLLGPLGAILEAS